MATEASESERCGFIGSIKAIDYLEQPGASFPPQRHFPILPSHHPARHPYDLSVPSHHQYRQFGPYFEPPFSAPFGKELSVHNLTF